MDVKQSVRRKVYERQENNIISIRNKTGGDKDDVTGEEIAEFWEKLSANFKNISKIGIYICISHFFYVILCAKLCNTYKRW